MRNRIRALLFLLGGAVACAGCPKPLPVPRPPADADAAQPAPVEATCERLCADGRARACSWAEPTPGGTPCEAVCHNATEGGPLTWDLGCRVRNLEADRGCPSVDLCR